MCVDGCGVYEFCNFDGVIGMMFIVYGSVLFECGNM